MNRRDRPLSRLGFLLHQPRQLVIHLLTVFGEALFQGFASDPGTIDLRSLSRTRRHRRLLWLRLAGVIHGVFNRLPFPAEFSEDKIDSTQPKQGHNETDNLCHDLEDLFLSHAALRRISPIAKLSGAMAPAEIVTTFRGDDEVTAPTVVLKPDLGITSQ